MTDLTGVVRSLTTSVLIVAGLAKLSAMASLGGDIFTIWSTVSQGLAEIYLGVWISYGFLPRVSRWMTLATFAVFFRSIFIRFLRAALPASVSEVFVSLRFIPLG
jgi:hypothetical protein